MNFFGTPYSCKIFHKDSRWTLSKAFLKSIKLMESGYLYSRHCSMMLRQLNICSLHELPFRTPACSSRRRLSMAASNHLRRTVENTFSSTVRRVMPRQFVHSILFPFLGSLMMVLFCQSSGTACIRQHALRSISFATTVGPPYFRSSA